MEKQSENKPSALTAAYEELVVKDATISDKEVGVAYLQARRLAVERLTEALETIATARESQWLHSLTVPILGSSTEDTAATLQYEAHGDVMFQSTPDGFGPALTALKSSESDDKVDEDADATTNEGASEGANEAMDTDKNDTLELDGLASKPIYPPSSGEDKVNKVCAECNPEIEESKVRKDDIIFDDVDEVWRCSECRWEVEADDKIYGNCHCLDEGGSMRIVNLSRIPDYERADDAASSTAPSSDQEGDSDDEDFIDDGEDMMEDERFGRYVDFDEAKTAQDGESTDSDATLDAYGLNSPTLLGPDDSEV